ncbi:hypothetical protein G9463_19665 [Haloarcula sp. JP-Z28]|uniref:hypothetical protein n=1 Tax=Haloarcula sp. JP-Z28 TaxID=2716715 RepID=UPI001404AA8E|nr:hypothetical protein [Haloarcula sp. JP-Z28]NHN65496.1 hypothetical protein [Haloarcula sp. JP-Z28]
MSTPREGTGSGHAPAVSTLEDVRSVVLKDFDMRVWRATEAALSTHAALHLAGVQKCPGLILEGPSGASKTTVLRFFKGFDQTYRSDDLTPAAFVSHDASRYEEDLEEVDLLPRIQHKTLINADMGSWFSGDRDTIQERMSTLAKVMDGSGYQTDSGVHGQRGYEGDYRFALLGATTPLSPRARDVMGHTGNRLLFHEMPPKNDDDQIIKDVFEGGEFSEKVVRSRSAVTEYCSVLWERYDGYGGFRWERTTEKEIQNLIGYLAKLVRYARAPVKENEAPTRESLYRPAQSLRDLARGHALACGREHIDIDDLEVCARVALGTMHSKRRPIVRLLVSNPSHKTFQASDVEEIANVSRPTARKQMELMDTLGIAECYEAGRNDTKKMRVRDEFAWPDGMPFPER